MTNELTLMQLGRTVWKRFQRDEVAGLSAQLAYFFLLSLFPFLIFLVTLIGYLPVDQLDIITVVQQYAPTQTSELIKTNLEKLASEHRGGLLSFGVIATIWAASNGINSVVRVLNKAYEVKESRSFFVSRLLSMMLTVAMILVIIVALLLPVFGKAIGTFIFSHFGLASHFLHLWNALRWILSFFIIYIVLVCLYFIAPNKRLKVKEVAFGAVFATICWQLVSLGFSYYVNHFANFTATYGSIGGIIVLMIWFYLSAMIIILGGEINAALRAFKYNEI